MDRAMGSLRPGEPEIITRSCRMTKFGHHAEITGHMVDLIRKYHELYSKLNQQGLIILPKYKRRFCSLMASESVDGIALSTLVAEMEESAKPIVQVEESPKEWVERSCKIKHFTLRTDISGDVWKKIQIYHDLYFRLLRTGFMALKSIKKEFCSLMRQESIDAAKLGKLIFRMMSAVPEDPPQVAVNRYIKNTCRIKAIQADEAILWNAQNYLWLQREAYGRGKESDYDAEFCSIIGNTDEKALLKELRSLNNRITENIVTL